MSGGDYFGNTYLGASYFGDSYFGPEQQQAAQTAEQPSDISANFVVDYRQTGYRVGNVLHLKSYEQILADRRRLAVLTAQRRVVVRKLLQRAVQTIGRERIEAALNELRKAA